MKNVNFLLLVAGVGVVLAGCETYDGQPNRTANGALIGGAVGATSGAIIGNNAGRGGSGVVGALIGGAVGAVAGGAVGNSMDHDARARLQTQAPMTYQRVEQGQPMSVGDVKALARASVGDDIIISQIQSTHSAYHLSAADIIDLRDAGVSQRVIQYMINTGDTVAAPVAAPQPQVVYVQQAPPPPPYETITVAPAPDYVWCGGEWVWSGSWVWHPGYWSPRPRYGVVWVSGGWAHDSRGWRHAPGHWR